MNITERIGWEFIDFSFSDLSRKSDFRGKGGGLGGYFGVSFGQGRRFFPFSDLSRKTKTKFRKCFLVLDLSWKYEDKQ